MKFPILEILDELDYTQISDKPEEKLTDLITKSLEQRFGDSTIKSIIDEASHINKKTYEEILLNPEIFFRTFEEIFGAPATKVITKILEDDLAKQGIFIPFDRSMSKLLNQIGINEIKKFVSNLQDKSHIFYLWDDKKLRDIILSEYFSFSDDLKLLVDYNHSNASDIENITFDELLKNKSQITTKFCELVTKVSRSNKSGNAIRCAGNDCTLWFKHDAYNELLEVENMVNEFQENYPLMYICAYNKNKMPSDEKLKKIISFHNYVILDNPLRVYKRSD